MTQLEYIETLIISDISGNITDEEKSELEQILATDQEARDLYEKIKKILTSEEARMVINAPPGEAPFKRTSTAPKVSPFSYYRIAGLSIAAIAIIIMGYFIIKQSANTHSNRLSFNKDSLQLRFDNGDMVNLHGFDTIDASGSTQHSAVLTYLLDTVKYNNQWATLHVPAGKFHNLRLPGGVMVLSYAATTIRFPVSFKHSRDIYVNGKAYIDVVPDAGNPFSAHLSHSTVQVLGTKLSVSCYDQKDEVSLIQGRAKFLTKKETKELNPGETARIQPDHSLKISPFNDNAMLSGIYRNKDITLKEIAAFIRENYQVNVKLDKRVENERFSVAIDCRRPVEEFLKTLNEVTHLDNAIVQTK